MSASNTPRHALVFGASGLVGRNLCLALAQAGIAVSAATRSRTSAERLRDWLAVHGVDQLPVDVPVDFADPDLLPGGPAAFAEVTEIFNCAGSYRFGMTVEAARTANVGSVEAVVAFAAQLPRLQRLVHVSGYRVGGQDPATVPWSADTVERIYSRLGPYEASKVEADAVLQARATQLEVPFSIVNPSSVIGDSRTGESDQQLGLATSLEDLWNGTLTALPGNAHTFVPVVTADYLAEFMTHLPADPEANGRSYWVLDDGTPALADLLTRIGHHYGVKVPSLRIPVGVIRRLPRAITKADPETLTFLSTDRYPTESADRFAARHGMTMPATEEAIFAWADYLAQHRFGTAPAKGRRFTQVHGVRTFELGRPKADKVVLPGLPVNADTWARVVEHLPASRAVDLPGLGASSGTAGDWAGWLDEQLAGGAAHLVGHSIGAAAALETAVRNGHRMVPRLTLVAPFFLQPPADPVNKLTPLTAAYLRRVTPTGLSQKLTGTTTHAEALESSVDDLHRATANTVASLSARAASTRRRNHLQQLLMHYGGQVHLITGEHDPLTEDAAQLIRTLPHVRTSIIRDAGHHPQLTHPFQLANTIRAGWDGADH